MLTGTLNTNEVDIMGSYVDHWPESHRVGDLSVEPNVFIHGEQPWKGGTDDSNDVAQHWDKDKAAIKGKSETSAARNPDGESQWVECLQARISCLEWRNFRFGKKMIQVTDLWVPSVGKESNVGAIEKDVESQPSWNEKFTSKPAFAHESKLFTVNPVPARWRERRK